MRVKLFFTPLQSAKICDKCELPMKKPLLTTNGLHMETVWIGNLFIHLMDNTSCFLPAEAEILISGKCQPKVVHLDGSLKTLPKIGILHIQQMENKLFGVLLELVISRFG